MKLVNYKVEALQPNAYDIYWEIDEVDTDKHIEDYYFKIYRSGSEEGPWELVAGEDEYGGENLIDTWHYTDEDLFEKIIEIYFNSFEQDEN